MHLVFFSWGIPSYSSSLVLEKVGIHTFKNKNKNEALAVIGYSPRKKPR